MNNRILKGVTGGILAAVMLSACGGGSGSSTPPVSGGGGTSQQKANVSLSFTVPGKTSAARRAAARRRNLPPNSISPSTIALGVSVVAHGGTFPALRSPQFAANIAPNVNANNAQCTPAAPDGSYSCTLLVAAPVGYDDIQIGGWDAAATNPGFGGTFPSPANLLAYGVNSNQLIQLNQQNTFNVAMSGVVYSANIVVSPNSLVAGTQSGVAGLNPTDPAVTVLAKDIDGNLITGVNPYVDGTGTAVTLRVTEAPAALTGFTQIATTYFPNAACATPPCSTADFTKSTDSTTIHYDGNPISQTTLILGHLGGNPAGPMVNSKISFTKTTNGVPIPGVPVISEFSQQGGTAGGLSIAIGTDGNVWYSESDISKLGYFNPTSKTSQDFSIPHAADFVLAAGDGDIWYADGNYFGKVNMAGGTPTAGSVTEYGPFPQYANDLSAATADDGNIYVSEYDTNGITAGIVKFDLRNPTSPASCTFPAAAPGQNRVYAMLGRGPDGNVWFGDRDNFSPNSIIGYFTSGGSPCAKININSLGATGSLPSGVAAGADGNLWVLEMNALNHNSYIGYYNIAGNTFTECPQSTLAHQYQNIAAGPDGNLYLSSGTAYSWNFTNYIARVTTACTALEFNYGLTPSVAGSNKPMFLTVGPSPATSSSASVPNSALWFPELTGGKFGVIQP